MGQTLSRSEPCRVGTEGIQQIARGDEANEPGKKGIEMGITEVDAFLSRGACRDAYSR